MTTKGEGSGAVDDASDERQSRPAPPGACPCSTELSSQEIVPCHGIPNLLPTGCTSVATTGFRSTARPARRMGDVCRQVSWLAAPSARLQPSHLARHGASTVALVRDELAAYSCGGSPGSGSSRHLPGSLFTPSRATGNQHAGIPHETQERVNCDQWDGWRWSVVIGDGAALVLSSSFVLAGLDPAIQTRRSRVALPPGCPCRARPYDDAWRLSPVALLPTGLLP